MFDGVEPHDFAGPVEVFAANHRSRADKAEIVLSVCSGSFFLGAPGLLEGLTAAAHAGDLDELRREFPAANVVEARYVDNGRIMVAGGAD